MPMNLTPQMATMRVDLAPQRDAVSVRLLLVCVAIVGLSALIGVTTGRYGGSYNFVLMLLLGFALRLLTGAPPRLGPGTMMVSVFWMNVVAYSLPAYGLFWARTRNRTLFVIALVSWTAVYLWVLVFSRNLSGDMP